MTFAVVREEGTDTMKDLVEEKACEELHDPEVADRFKEVEHSWKQDG